MRLRFVKRGELNRKTNLKVQSIAFLLAVLTTTLFIAFLKLNPLAVYASMIDGSLGSAYRIKETINSTIPLVITSLGISIAFKMQFWNIGAEGQITVGAMFATFVAMNFSNLDKPLLIVLMMAAGALGGGLWALFPAWLKAKWGTNETIITLMMNYIAIKWVMYLQFGPWKDPAAFGFPKIANFSANALLPNVFGVHIGWIIALILVVIVHIFMKYSKKGYEIAVLGESENTAKYAGINIKNTIIVSMFISGGLCGLSGMIQASGVADTLFYDIAGGVGFTAIITSWLSGLSAPIILIVSFLFSMLMQGGSFIQTNFGIPQSAAQIIQGIILFFILGSNFFVRYRLDIRKEEL